MTARRVAEGDKHYIHNQIVSASSWVVNHNLGKIPSITVVDSANTTVEGDVVHNSTNQSVLTFASPFSGTAYCN